MPVKPAMTTKLQAMTYRVPAMTCVALRAFGLAPGARRKDAKRMFREARKAGLL